MPIYEYSCGACRHRFEVLVRRASDKPAECPKCGAVKPAKQFSSFAAKAATGSDSLPSCASSSCATGSCATGSCPFSGS